MTININGTTGISGVDGSAGTPAIQGSDTNTGVFFGTNTIDLSTDGTSRLSIDSSGNVGIGTTTTNWSLLDGLIVQTGNGSAGVNIASANSTDNAYLAFGYGTTHADQFSAYVGRIGDDTLSLGTANTERARIDSSGRLLVGTSSARTNAPGGTEGFLVEGSTNNASANRFIQHIWGANSTDGPYIGLGKHRGTSNGQTDLLSSGDELGGIYFQGADGSNFKQGASILSYVDGTPGANDMPGRLVFSTTADGASSPTPRLRIGSTGNILFQNITNYVAPDSDNAIANGASGRRWSEIWAANGTIQTSDQRAKTDITSAALGTSFIKALCPVSYKWVEGGKRHTGEFDEDGNFIYESVPGERTHWGFIAQEVKQAVDAAGVDFGGWVLTDKDDPDSEQALRYDQFIAPLTKALQETITKIETLEARLSVLEGGAN